MKVTLLLKLPSTSAPKLLVCSGLTVTKQYILNHTIKSVNGFQNLVPFSDEVFVTGSDDSSSDEEGFESARSAMD